MTTNAVEHVAVLLVPGIFASHLSDPGGGLAWPVNESVRIFRHIIASPSQQRDAFAPEKAGRFLAHGPKSAVPADVDRSAGWQNVHTDSYHAFLGACQRAGVSGSKKLKFEPHVCALGYNFSLSNSTSAWVSIVPQALNALQSLRKKLARAAHTPLMEELKLPRLIFVTHSMGALAVRYALKSCPTLNERCICVIHVAAPNAGAPETLMRFIRGSEDEPPVSLLFGDKGWKCLTSASAVGAGFQLLPYPMIRLRKKFTAFRNVVLPADNTALPEDDPFPALFRSIVRTQLAKPGRGVTVKRRISGNPNDVDLSFRVPEAPDILERYQTAQSHAGAINDDIQGHLTKAKRFHDSELIDYLFPRTGAVVLTGKPTVQKVELEFNAEAPAPPVTPAPPSVISLAREIVTNDGDGTVPLSSQKHLLPDVFTGKNGIHFDPIVEIDGVFHADALGAKAAESDPLIFEKILDLMSKLYETAPPTTEGVIAPVETKPEKSTTLLAAFHASAEAEA